MIEEFPCCSSTPEELLQAITAVIRSTDFGVIHQAKSALMFVGVRYSLNTSECGGNGTYKL